MKRIAILVATLALLSTGAALAATTTAADDCTCQATQTQSQGLSAVEQTP